MILNKSIYVGVTLRGYPVSIGRQARGPALTSDERQEIGHLYPYQRAGHFVEIKRKTPQMRGCAERAIGHLYPLRVFEPTI